MKKIREKILEAIWPVYKIRQETKKMVFLHIKLKEESKIRSLAEMAPLLNFKFGKEGSHLFLFDDFREIFIYAENPRNQALAYFDKLVTDSFSREDIKLEILDLDEAGIVSLCAHLKRIAPDDEIVDLSLLRLARNGNSMLVLDDDPMVLKTMENILKFFGRVGVEKGGDNFIKLYKEYAPNIVFIDMHLANERGSEIIRKIKSEIDPNLYAIMISADMTRDTVLEVKNVGISGYVVKPFNRDMIYKHLMKAPTFVPKKS